jgi:hypothetical protein
MEVLCDITGLEVFEDEWAHPVKYGVHYETLQEEFIEWFLSFSTFNEGRTRLFVKSDYPLLTTVAWPDAEQDRARDICGLVAALTTRDDEVDDERDASRTTMIAAELRSIRNGFRGTDTKWEPLYRTIWEHFAARMPAGQFVRLTKCVERFVEGCLRWEQLQLGDSASLEIDEYCRSRHIAVGQPIDMVLVEYALGIDLDESILRDPVVQRMQAAHIDYIWLMQDLLSYRKEVVTDASSNVITSLAVSGGSDIQNAVNETHRILRAKISEFDAACKDLANSPVGDRWELWCYIEGLRDWTSGWVDWTVRSPRYDPNEYTGL